MKRKKGNTSIEDDVLETFFEMYKEIELPLTAEGVAVRVGCSKWTALHHLQANQEKVSSTIGAYGRWLFTPRKEK